MKHADRFSDLPELERLKAGYRRMRAPAWLAARIVANAARSRRPGRWARVPLVAGATAVLTIAIVIPLLQLGDSPRQVEYRSKYPSLSMIRGRMPQKPKVTTPGLASLPALPTLPRRPGRSPPGRSDSDPQSGLPEDGSHSTSSFIVVFEESGNESQEFTNIV